MGCFLSRQREAELDYKIQDLRQQIQTKKSDRQRQKDRIREMQIQIDKLQKEETKQSKNLQLSSSQLNKKLEKVQQIKTQSNKLKTQIGTNNTEISNSSMRIMKLQQQLALAQKLKAQRQPQSMKNWAEPQLNFYDKIQQRRKYLQDLNIKCYQKQLQIGPNNQNQNQLQTILSLKRQIQENQSELTCLLLQRQQLQNKLIILNNNIAFIRLTLYNNQEISFSVLCKTTIRQLKLIIFKKYNDQLLPQQMVLLDNQQQINDDQQIQHIFTNNRVKLGQRIAQVWELEGYQGDKNKQDPVFVQMGVVKMRCGHQYSREGMKSTINYQIDSLKQDFLCCQTMKIDGFACRQKFETKESQLVAGLTKDEWNLIQQKLSSNFVMRNTTKCLNQSCSSSILRTGTQSKKILCPVCRTNICIDCGELWRWEGNSVCKGQRCVTIRSMIANSLWDRVFSMYRHPNTDDHFQVKVPTYRACPKCKCLVENTAYCKHTKCPCGQYFCFVCLVLSDGEHWDCGGGYEYCQRIAPNQTLDDLGKIRI